MENGPPQQPIEVMRKHGFHRDDQHCYLFMMAAHSCLLRGKQTLMVAAAGAGAAAAAYYARLPTCCCWCWPALRCLLTNTLSLLVASVLLQKSFIHRSFFTVAFRTICSSAAKCGSGREEGVPVWQCFWNPETKRGMGRQAAQAPSEQLTTGLFS